MRRRRSAQVEGVLLDSERSDPYPASSVRAVPVVHRQGGGEELVLLYGVVCSHVHYSLCFMTVIAIL